MQTGKVKWFNGDKGYGFISSEIGDVFVHAKELKKSGLRDLGPGDEVVFEARNAEKGLSAVNVQLVRKNLTPKYPQRRD